MKTRELIRNTRFMVRYNAHPYYMWPKPDVALRNARMKRRLPHACAIYEQLHSARHGGHSQKRMVYMNRLEEDYLHASACGWWRPKDRLHVTLPDGRITLRAHVY